MPVSKECSHFTTLGTYIILTEPPTKNNCFTATIYLQYVITLHGFNLFALACKQKGSINFVQWPETQNYPPGHKIEELNVQYLYFAWIMWSSMGWNLLLLKIQYWANMTYLIAFLFMVELIHCYIFNLQIPVPGQETTIIIHIIVTKMTWFTVHVNM